MKIGLMTSGGDAPGMNACINSVVNECCEKGHELIIFGSGFQGIIDNKILKYDKFFFNNVTHLGGSIIKSERSKEFLTGVGFDKAVKNLKKHKIDCLIGIGGDGTFKGLQKLSESGINVIGIPATIDNDLYYVQRTLGFDTAVNTVVESIDKIKQSMQSMNSGCIIEVMGRNSGDIALFSALATKSTVVKLPEKPLEIEDAVKIIKKAIKNGEDSPIVIITENQADINEWAENLEKAVGIRFRKNVLGYIQRGGTPSVYDRILAIQFGIGAVRLIENEVYNVALSIEDGKIKTFTFNDALNCFNRFNSYLLNFLN